MSLQTSRFIALLCVARFTLAFNYGQCCTGANDAGVLFNKTGYREFDPLLTNFPLCSQDYNATIPPAPDVYVPYHYCKTSCSGFELSKGDKPSTWAAPVVQFILPSLIFSMSIPRRTMFVPSWDIGKGSTLSIRSLFWSMITAIPLAIFAALDTIIWVAVILALAGPLMVSGMVEALLDYKILRSLSKYQDSDLSDASRLRLIVAVVCGNLRLRERLVVPNGQDDLEQNGQHNSQRNGQYAPLESPDPLLEVPAALEKQDEPNRKSQLMNLMSAQGDFGALVGAPVVFYLGGFIYTTLDLFEDPSAQDAAISLAFGVEWMIVVHVAIIAGCLLASNNPSAVSSMAGQAPVAHHKSWMSLVFESRFQPVSMWRRGSNKEKWLAAVTQGETSNDHPKLLLPIQQDARIGFRSYLGWVIIPTLILISLPPAAGAVVAWKTPPVGWACRSLTLVCYAACQLLLILVQELRAWSTRNSYPWTPTYEATLRERFVKDVSTVLNLFETTPVLPFLGLLPGCPLPRYLSLLEIMDWLLCFLSLFTSLGGTIMQIMGVYKNCLCYVTAEKWLNLDEAYVQVASDTLDARNSSRNWIVIGCVATGFMGGCAFLGWAYQKMIRTEYRRHVNSLYNDKK